jgi:hypothetical protein
MLISVYCGSSGGVVPEVFLDIGYVTTKTCANIKAAIMWRYRKQAGRFVVVILSVNIAAAFQQKPNKKPLLQGFFKSTGSHFKRNRIGGFQGYIGSLTDAN